MQFYSVGAHYNDLLEGSENEDKLVFEIYEEDEEIKRDDQYTNFEKFTFTSIIDKIPVAVTTESQINVEAPPYRTNKSAT